MTKFLSGGLNERKNWHNFEKVTVQILSFKYKPGEDVKLKVGDVVVAGEVYRRLESHRLQARADGVCLVQGQSAEITYFLSFLVTKSVMWIRIRTMGDHLDQDPHGGCGSGSGSIRFKNCLRPQLKKDRLHKTVTGIRQLR